MLNIVICDDEPYFQNRIKELISVYLNDLEYEHAITCFNSGKELLKKGTDITKYDIAFLDVQMGEIDGIETAKHIREMSEDMFIVFITASLGLSNEKKTVMWMAAERLLNDGYEVEFVAGVLGNIQNEGTVGKFESSAYISHPELEPAYLKYMDEHFDYRNKFSGKSIMDVGISATLP